MSKYVIIDKTKYEVRGWYGSFLISNENGVKIGDTRVIKNFMFYAYQVYKPYMRFLFPFAKAEVHWRAIGKCKNLDYETLKGIQIKLLEI